MCHTLIVNYFNRIYYLIKLPLYLFYSVIVNNHERIKEIIKLTVIQIIFDHEFLQSYLIRRARQVSARRDLSQEFIDTLGSSKVESVILKHVTRLFSGPEDHLLTVLGVTDKKLLDVTKPLLLTIFSKIAPVLMEGLGNSKEVSQVLN